MKADSQTPVTPGPPAAAVTADSRDPAEIEAANVADAIVAGRVVSGIWAQARPGVLHRCGDPDHPCACPPQERTGKAEEGPPVQLSRAETRPVTDRVNTRSVRSVVTASGQPLDTASRAFMEERFHRSFDRVRVHADADAAASAAGLHAAAYTFGHHIVFADGHYPLSGERDVRLLAHELTHVVQQESAQPRISRLAETEEEVETEEETETEEDDLERRGLPPRTFAGAMERARRHADMQQSIRDYEIPIATLEPGGRPPDFITVEGTQEVMGEHANFSYRLRSIHVIDAITYAVSQANTEADLRRVLERYIGVTQPRPWMPTVSIPVGLISYPRGFDPGHAKRLAAYRTAVDRRVQQVPALATSTASQVGMWRETGSRGCKERAVPPKGQNLNPMADLFAAHYCRDPRHQDVEWEVMTPSGLSVTYDGKIGTTVYECKCGYLGMIKDLVSDEEWRRSRAERRLAEQFDEQMRRQLRIADECGFGYRYIVDSELLRTLLNARWPMVPITEQPWSESCG
jgi:hypothetical protein